MRFMAKAADDALADELAHAQQEFTDLAKRDLA
jgi:hypothetical protein